MTSSNETRVAILGAGLTGMSAAWHLRARGVGCRVIERLAQPGGHAVTVEERGYRFDRTGHLLHARDDATLDLARRFMGPDVREIARKSAVWSHGVYTRYPFQANAFGLPPAVAYECVLGFIAAQQKTESVAPANFEEFCLSRFGAGISRHFMIPYNSRQWGIAPREITAAWCERFVPQPSIEDVIAGAVGLFDRELGYNARFLYPTQGIGRLSEGMAAALGDIELGVEPERIVAGERALHLPGERLRYDALISTAPLPVLVRLIEDAPAAVREAAGRLRATHLYYLDLALRSECGQRYHWVYVPEERYPFYRVGCYSHFSPAMAPAGKACLYVELVDRNPPELGVVLPRVARALVEMQLIKNAEAILFARVRRIDHAYVVFDHAYYPALEVIRPYLAAQGIVSAGRYGGWNYSSMSDALAFGRDAAAEAATLSEGNSLG